MNEKDKRIINIDQGMKERGKMQERWDEGNMRELKWKNGGKWRIR